MTERIRLTSKPKYRVAQHATNKGDGRHSSRVSSGKDLLPSEDGRSVWARIMRDTYRAVIAHCGGDDVISDTRRMAARRIAALESELIAHEDRIASIRQKGKEPPISLLQIYTSLAAQQHRIAKDIGWDRHQKNVKDMDLQSYIAGKSDGHGRNRRSHIDLDHDEETE